MILKSRTALNAVIEEADLDYTYEELEKMITASAVNSTEVFEIVPVSTTGKCRRPIPGNPRL